MVVTVTIATTRTRAGTARAHAAGAAEVVTAAAADALAASLVDAYGADAGARADARACSHAGGLLQ